MTRSQANSQYEQLFRIADDKGPEEVRLTMRELALSDLFFLLVRILGRKDADRDWIYERCVEVQRDPNGHLDVWSREHYKSTIITLALTIQDILRNPESTFGIFSFNRPIAKGFLRQIKYEFENNAKLKFLFPDILWENPRAEAPKWSEDSGIIVKRKGNPKEATVEAWGLVDGQPTSKHFSHRIYDDVITIESVTTPEMIDKVTRAWEMSLNLGTDGGIERYVGTFYHFADTYSVMINREAVIPRIYPATDNGQPDGNPVLMSLEYYNQKRNAMGAYTFNSQMLCNPKADNVGGFQEEWLCYWGGMQYKNLNIYILVDPAGSKKKGSDYTAIWVIGMGYDKNYYVIDLIRDRLSLTERANVLFSLHAKYKPILVGYEKYGLQSDIEHMRDRMNRENYRFRILEMGGRAAKEDRIRALEPLFRAGRIWLPENGIVHTDYEGKQVDLVRTFIREEYAIFPFVSHDDMLDCLARILDPDFPAHFPDGPAGAALRVASAVDEVEEEEYDMMRSSL